MMFRVMRLRKLIMRQALEHAGGLSEHGQILQHRDNADDNDNDAGDLLRAGINGQHADQIKNQNDNQKCN